MTLLAIKKPQNVYKYFKIKTDAFFYPVSKVTIYVMRGS